MSSFYIVTHKEIPWKLPFEHRLIGVEGFVPTQNEGIAACEKISRLLDSETAFGALRALPAINEELISVGDDEHVFTGSYRLFLSSETQQDWLSPVMQENKIIHPSELLSNWESLVAIRIPAGIDIMIPAPRLLPDTILGQYSRVHHLDDLLLAVGCAIRAGLLEPLTVPKMLSSNTLIPYGNFATSKKIKHEFNDRLWWCANDFYKKYYTPRTGYQRRVIDFVFERIVSMATVQMIVKNQLNCLSCRNIWISDDGDYIPSV
jgi:hypothetical protein